MVLDQQIVGAIRGQGRWRTVSALRRGVPPVPIRAVGYAADFDYPRQEYKRSGTDDGADDTEHQHFEAPLLPHCGTLPLRGHERLFGDEDQARPKHGSSLDAQRGGRFAGVHPAVNHRCVS